MKKKKYKCPVCEDTGKFTNPFDQTIKCDCQIKPRKRNDYRGFVLNIWDWENYGVSYGMSDLRELAKTYNTPIPKEYRNVSIS